MTTATHAALATPALPSARRRMEPMRKVALIGGVMYLITFIVSLPTLTLYHDVLHNPSYILGNGSNTPLLWGALLDILTALSGIGTAVALYPMTKRVSKSAAIGFVSSRTVEAAVILVGVLSLMTIVTLRGTATGADATSLVTTGRALVALHNWTFLLGPGLMAGVNGLFLATIMYKSRLVPRIIPTLGLVGAPLILISDAGTLFGGWDQLSAAGVFLGAPIAIWEFSLGCWLTFKGFKPAAVAALDAAS
jgi:Domain of unknown function (DUF4386)